MRSFRLLGAAALIAATQTTQAQVRCTMPNGVVITQQLGNCPQGATKAQAADGTPIGHVTSGLLSPSLNQPVAMGYVQAGSAAIGTEVLAIVRGKPVPMVVASMPFVPTRYYRG